MHRALFNWVSWNQIIAITTANHEMDNITRSQWKLVEQTSTLPEVRENGSEQVAICFSFESDLLRKWCEFSGPNTKRKKAKPNQSRITFEIIGNCSETNWKKLWTRPYAKGNEKWTDKPTSLVHSQYHQQLWLYPVVPRKISLTRTF